MYKGINTPKRYIYLNTYAFLLLFAAISIGCLPLYKFGTWFVVIQIIAALIFLSYAIKIFKTFKAKKKRYAKLMDTNSTKLNPDSFYEYIAAPSAHGDCKFPLPAAEPSEYQHKILKAQHGIPDSKLVPAFARFYK
jgi:ABC-type transport system involved in Fe-S cluster assembly fused permease/ATPase subunit